MADRAQEGLPAWELIAIAVEPEMQGLVISTQPLDMLLKEIKRRVARETGMGDNETRILLRKLKEMIEGYYLEKRWTTTQERKISTGSAGSMNQYTVAYGANHVLSYSECHGPLR